MSKLSMIIGEKTVLLRWDVEAWSEIEQMGYGLEKMLDALESDTPTEARLVLCAAMINSGARYTGETADMTPEWLRKNLTPTAMRAITALSNLAFRAGNRREFAQDNDDDKVDVVLEELEKKRDLSAEKKD